MKARGVLVKNVSGMHALLANCLRLTVGTPEENHAMLAGPEGKPVNAPRVPEHGAAARAAEVTPQHRRDADPGARSTWTAAAAASLPTGIGFFDHMLDQIARHGLIDLDIDATGDLHIDGHHTVEDVGITLGLAVAPRRWATRRASAAMATPTCRWTKRCRAW